MFKRIGVLALMLSAAGAVVLPSAASAQEGYYARGDNYHHSDRGDRRDSREWREQERRQLRAEERREHDFRRDEWRQRAWRDHDRAYRYQQDRRSDAYFGFSYQH